MVCFDDLKISHVNTKAVDKSVNWLDTLYPGVTATRGKIHDYLGMTFDFSMPGEVKVSIYDYIGKVLEAFSEDLLKLCQVQQQSTYSKCIMKTSGRYFRRSRALCTITLLTSHTCGIPGAP